MTGRYLNKYVPTSASPCLIQKPTGQFLAVKEVAISEFRISTWLRKTAEAVKDAPLLFINTAINRGVNETDSIPQAVLTAFLC